MTCHPAHPPVSALRERMIEDMTVRGIGAKTRHDYVRHTVNGGEKMHRRGGAKMQQVV